MFSRYKDPKTAKAVYAQYASDIAARGLEDKAESVVTGCGTSLQLDTELNFLLTAKLPNRGSSRMKKLEDEANVDAE